MKKPFNPLLILGFLISTNSYSSITVSYSAGYALSSSKDFDEYSAQAKGLSQTFQLGLRKELNEVGIYFDNNSLKADIKHDGENAAINLKSNAVGAYYTRYFEKAYLQVAYGKSTTKESISSSLSSGQVSTIENLYGVEDGRTLSTSHLKVRIGKRFFRMGSSIINGFYERTMDQDTSRKNDLLGLDLKISF